MQKDQDFKTCNEKDVIKQGWERPWRTAVSQGRQYWVRWVNGGCTLDHEIFLNI